MSDSVNGISPFGKTVMLKFSPLENCKLELLALRGTSRDTPDARVEIIVRHRQQDYFLDEARARIDKLETTIETARASINAEREFIMKLGD